VEDVGEETNVAERYCSNCGHELSEDAQFCSNCGSPVHQTARVPTPEAAVPVPPPPQQQEAGAQPLEQAEAQPQGRWTKGRLALGCLGVFFVIFLVGASLAALGGTGGGNEGEKSKGGGGGKDTTSNPMLAVSSPSESTTVTSDTFEVKGKVTPATSEVTVNGGGVTPDADGSFGTLLTLDLGKNEIKITAAKGSNQAEYSQVVTRKLSEKESAAKKAAEEEAAKKKAAEEEAAKKRVAEEAAAKKRAVEAAKNATIGDTVRVGDAEWTVTNARRAKVLRQKGFGSFGDTKQGNFVIVGFRFTNQSNEAVTLDTISLPLHDSQGRVYEADTDTFGYIPAEKDIFLTQVNPGVTQEGAVIYTVAPDASGFTLHAGDLEFFGADEAKITLGF
jgi:hypothetical protein